MKLFSFVALILGTIGTASAADQLTCIVYEGAFSSKVAIRQHTSTDPVGTQMRYYGGDKHAGASFLWGVDIGFTASDPNPNRFQIFAYDETTGQDLTHVDVDAGQPIDLAIYVSSKNLSVHCKEKRAN